MANYTGIHHLAMATRDMDATIRPRCAAWKPAGRRAHPPDRDLFLG